MFVSIFENSGLTAKKLLAYLFFLFIVAGCDSVATTENSRSQVTPEPKNPQVTLNSSVGSVVMNGSVMLTWDSTNASSCTSSDNWSGSGAVKGSRMIEDLTSDQNFSISCSGVGGTTTAEVSVTVDGVAVPMVTVSASPVNLAYSGSTEISWNSANATSCVASGDWSGSRSTSGSTSFSNLLSGKTYSLTCSGPGGNASDSVNVTVAGPAAASLNLSASPSSLPFNGSTTLSWDSGNTNSCTASGDWSGGKVTSGLQVITALTADSSFSLSCSGPGGTVNRTVNVTVAAPAPTVSLSANPGSVAQNGSTTLSWNSTDATSCVASGDWSGSKGTSGPEVINGLMTDSQFTLTCSGAGGSVSETVSVTVAAPAPTLSFSASPDSVAQNDSTTLSWSSTDATSCVASGDWSGNKGTSGSESTGSLTIDGQYILTCSGAGGSVNESVNVTVVLSSNGTALVSWTPPTENTDGSTLTDLAGYKIHYGTSPGNYTHTEVINDPGITSFMVENLASADWYFAVTSFNSSDIESSYSTEVSKTIN